MAPIPINGMKIRLGRTILTNQKKKWIDTKYRIIGPCMPKNLAMKGDAFDEEDAQEIYIFLMHRYIPSNRA